MHRVIENGFTFEIHRSLSVSLDIPCTRSPPAFSVLQFISPMAERKAVIKNADMSEDMQQDAVDCASQALEKYNIEKVCESFK